MSKNVKQVIIMRKDLGMRKGKMVAQGAHASMKVILELMNVKISVDGLHYSLDVPNQTPIHTWLSKGFAKITLYVKSEEELLALHEEAKDAELPCALITDSGRTEFHGVPTNTCIAIGPAYSDDIDKITGELNLL